MDERVYSNNATFIDKNGKEKNRQKCMIYSRTMGYIRGFDGMNAGKKSEHYSRKYFIDTSLTNIDLQKRANADFVEQFS